MKAGTLAIVNALAPTLPGSVAGLGGRVVSKAVALPSWSSCFRVVTTVRGKNLNLVSFARHRF